MKKIRTFLLVIIPVIFSPTLLISQNTYQLKGIVYDSLTKNPAKYVNIGILEKGIGTVSSDSGRFQLTIPANKINDTLTFSRIGYQTRKIPLAQILKKKSFLLTRKAIPLHEVKIASKQLKVKEKGNVSRSRSIVLAPTIKGYLGTELGTLIRLPDKPVYIKDFNFHIIYNRPDSVRFRLNIYAYNKKIGENLLKRNIYFTVPGKTLGDYKVDLSKYDIVAHGNVFVSIEDLAVYNAKGPDPNKKNDWYLYNRLNISATITGAKSFYRKVSMDKWHKTKLHFSPGFWLTVAY